MRAVALALALGAWLVAGEARAASGTDSACDALGSNCACYETEDATSKSSAGCGGGFENPNSTTTAPCGDGGVCALYTQGNMTYSSATGLGLPAGITNVLEKRSTSVDGTGNLYANFRGASVTSSSTRRIGIRWYGRYSSDYQTKDQGTGGTCESNKIAEISYSSGSAVHWDAAEFGSERLTIINFDGSDGDSSPDSSWNVGKSGTLTIPDCKSQWCRFELYVSGNIEAGTGLYAEAYIETLDGTKSVTWTKSAIGTACPGGSCTGGDIELVFINLLRQGTCAGSRYTTHRMMAAWDTDEGQRIGPAAEVEGASVPTAACSVTPSSGTATLAVSATDQSTGSPTSWAWDYYADGGSPDGEDSTSQNPTFNLTAGTWAVQLTATNGSGSSSPVECAGSPITVSAPAAATYCCRRSP